MNRMKSGLVAAFTFAVFAQPTLSNADTVRDSFDRDLNRVAMLGRGLVPPNSADSLQQAIAAATWTRHEQRAQHGLCEGEPVCAGFARDLSRTVTQAASPILDATPDVLQQAISSATWTGTDQYRLHARVSD